MFKNNVQNNVQKQCSKQCQNNAKTMPKQSNGSLYLSLLSLFYAALCIWRWLSWRLPIQLCSCGHFSTLFRLLPPCLSLSLSLSFSLSPPFFFFSLTQGGLSSLEVAGCRVTTLTFELEFAICVKT